MEQQQCSVCVAFNHFMGLLEYDQHEVIGPLLRLLAEAMRDKMPAEEESDESMPAEANSQRGRRYADCGMPEASDPEFWTLMLYGPTGDRPPEDEAAEGPMEF